MIVSDGKDSHWAESARDLVSAIILHLISTKGGHATLPDMREVLTLPDDEFARRIAEMATSDYAFVAQPAARFLRETNEIKSIISTAITQTRFLSDPAIAKTLRGSDFLMQDFKRSIATLYIILPSRYLAAYARFFRLLVVSAIDQLTAKPGGTKTVIMLDEFAQLGHLSPIETAFGLVAGYNVQLWPFVQDLNQLNNIYGNRWQSFVAAAGVVQWFTPNDGFTAEHLSKRMGNYTEVVVTSTTGTSKGASSSTNTGSRGPSAGGSTGSSEGTSEGKSYSKTGVPLWSPEDLYQLGDHVQLVTLAGLKYPIFCGRERYYESPSLAALVDPDPYHLA